MCQAAAGQGVLVDSAVSAPSGGGGAGVPVGVIVGVTVGSVALLVVAMVIVVHVTRRATHGARTVSVVQAAVPTGPAVHAAGYSCPAEQAFAEFEEDVLTL